MDISQMEFYHRELQDWHNSLKFYADEIQVFKDRLAEVVNKNTKLNLLSRAEHFQNQFIVQKEQFDLLTHDINTQELTIRKNINTEYQSINSPVLEAQHRLRERIQSAEKIFLELKHEFYSYLSQVF
ncbi:MAG TPA: hypothetical protein VJ647_06375 [Chitinophagaceae bacterium]|nr:hypothetical protein [Chitinophagaceae bacterium]